MLIEVSGFYLRIHIKLSHTSSTTFNTMSSKARIGGASNAFSIGGCYFEISRIVYAMRGAFEHKVPV